MGGVTQTDLFQVAAALPEAAGAAPVSVSCDTCAEAVALVKSLTREHGGYWTIDVRSSGTYGMPGHRWLYVVAREDPDMEFWDEISNAAVRRMLGDK